MLLALATAVSSRLQLACFVVLVLGLCGLVSAGDEIYKWRDKEGVLHFSSTPPTADDSVDEQGVEGLDIIPQGKQGVGIKETDGGRFCGNRRLRLEQVKATDLPVARSMLSQLLAEKKRASKNYSAILVSIGEAKLKPEPDEAETASNKEDRVRRSALKTQLDEVNCEIRWVRRQISNIERLSLKSRVKDKGITDRVKQLEKQKRSFCKAGIDKMTAEQRRSYKACLENFEKEIERLIKQKSS